MAHNGSKIKIWLSAFESIDSDDALRFALYLERWVESGREEGFQLSGQGPFPPELEKNDRANSFALYPHFQCLLPPWAARS